MPRNLDIILNRIMADLPVTDEEIDIAKEYTNWVEKRQRRTVKVLSFITGALFLFLAGSLLVKLYWA
jgi:hypothetical protein